MAYIWIELAGKQTFGGYLSIDGDKKIRLEDDMLIAVSAGTHYLNFSSQSGAERGMAKLNAAVGNYRTAAFMEKDAVDGDITVQLEENNVMKLTIVSDNNGHILDYPSYEVKEFDDEEFQTFHEEFEKRMQHAMQQANRPRRSKAFGWGIAISILSVGILFSNAGDPGILYTWLAILAVGLIMIFAGAKKRTPRTPKGLEEKSDMTAFLLCLFLGGFGAHWFYLGRTGRGLLYLFTGGLLGIGAIIDFFVLLSTVIKNRR